MNRMRRARGGGARVGGGGARRGAMRPHAAARPTRRLVLFHWQPKDTSPLPTLSFLPPALFLSLPSSLPLSLPLSLAPSLPPNPSPPPLSPLAALSPKTPAPVASGIIIPLDADKPKIAFHAAMMAIQNFGFFVMYWDIWGATPSSAYQDGVCDSTRYVTRRRYRCPTPEARP